MFRQFFDAVSCTLSYCIADQTSQQAILIDPVLSQADAYMDFLVQENLTLAYLLETHVHADHITAAGWLRKKTGAKIAIGADCHASAVDVQLNDGDSIQFGVETIKVIATPGHTAGSMSYLWRDRLFTGDSLLIGGCGRTDFQNGDAVQLYHSILQKLFSLPDDTLVYPGHDYHGRRVSNIAEEKTLNPRLANKSLAEFVAIMSSLKLDKPKLIDIAVPANKNCGPTEYELIQG